MTDFHVSLDGRGDLADRIYRQLLAAILDGRLRAGERLPPSRELAQRLAVSRNTVTVAYDRLTAEGFLVGRVGAGTFVGDVAPGQAEARAAPSGTGIRPRELWRTLRTPSSTSDAPPRYDFRVGTPDARLFPLQVWRRLLARELRHTTLDAFNYGDPAGHAGLRAAIARHVGVSRSVRSGAEDVLVTQGAQQALDLIGRVLVEPGEVVAVEEPGYWPARLLFQSLGARVAGVPVDGEGLDVSAIPDAARLVYTTPSHQFPTGTAMSLARRTALLDWARRRDAVIVEDDYDSEFRFGDRPLEPLQSLDTAGRVLYVGSFSKTLLPMLRLGFVIAPASLRTALRTAKQLSDWHGELPAQAALARFIADGLLGRQVRRASRIYAARHELIVTTLHTEFADLLDLTPSAAGLHLCARLRQGVSLDFELARRRGVAAEDLAAYCGEQPAQRGLVLGYGAIEVDQIPEGLRLLHTCLARA
ncbi:PLP-dependent aminotransferase family protein [Kutzneria albida]|uniref:GntR family transcription regulator fused with aminotransferase n=1 Tax=Kutzneria albida DSM 43870 TaxID=1449976 RepID=W5W7I3_9PSEU|nr:PLP-dependent aminotransferase family protein [Kutzneria albida]AHH96511.1 GntR family transcription regulator fused with aminotransferase [Kutzneria albida DSM 43870]